MRIWFDTEFIEDGKTIRLISIGMVRDDGAEYYAETVGADFLCSTDWLNANVLPHLIGKSAEKYRAQIAREIVEFAGAHPEFWAYYADYDWVVLCQLYGTMMDLPKGWPMFCLDVKQFAWQRGIDKIPVPQAAEHSAIHDARWTREAWIWLGGASRTMTATGIAARSDETPQAAQPREGQEPGARSAVAQTTLSSTTSGKAEG